MTKRISEALIVLFFVAANGVAASPLFDSNEILAVDLTGPLSELSVRDKTIELPFTLTAEGLEHQILVRLRGKSRLRVCRFPPMRFNFDEEDEQSSVFAGQDKLKLVTHCRNKKASEIDTVEEYLAYRIFNLISESSFKVRLLRLTYVDTARKRPSETHYGFLIEPEAELARRIGARKLSLEGVSLDALNHRQLTDVFVFQYLIGNTDYSLVMTEGEDECCHNGDIFEIEGERYLVPYDFDLAGIVNARYAYPHPSLRMRNVKQRRYRGFCATHQQLETSIRHIMDVRQEILALPQDTPFLSTKEKTTINDYLHGFFDRSARDLLDEFNQDCL